MNTVLFIIVALAAGSPIAAAVIVSIASRREDYKWSLGDTTVGQVQIIARRIVGFYTDYRRPRPSTKPVPVSLVATAHDRRKPAEQGSQLMIASR